MALPREYEPRTLTSLRICLVVPYDLADEGGVKRHALHLAECLRQRGDDVIVAGPVRSGAAVDGVRGFGGVINVPANGAANYVALLTPPWDVRRFFREGRFDLIHVHEPFVPLLAYYAVWLARAAAVVATFHMYAENERPEWLLARRLVGRLLRAGIDRAIAVSRPAALFAERAWSGPLTVIPNGVPTSVFQQPTGGGAVAGSQPLRLLFVGSWRDPRKGLPYLLDAVRRLRGDGAAVTLDVVGSGPNGLPPPSDGITFHGRVAGEAALAAHYRACDVFVSPATGQESFGIVLLEAMASGRPVICSDIDGYREVLPREGGRLVPPGDVAALAGAVRAFAADSGARERMGGVNRRAAESYEWDVLADRVREEYLEAIAIRRASLAAGERLRQRATV